MCVDCIGLYHAYSHGIILCVSSGLWLYAPSENIYLDLYCANRDAATHEDCQTHADIFHFEGDKIKEVWTMYDALTTALELGIVEKVQPAQSVK